MSNNSGGCPFKHFDENHLKVLLERMDIQDTSEILNLFKTKKDYASICGMTLRIKRDQTINSSSNSTCCSSKFTQNEMFIPEGNTHLYHRPGNKNHISSKSNKHITESNHCNKRKRHQHNSETKKHGENSLYLLDMLNANAKKQCDNNYHISNQLEPQLDTLNANAKKQCDNKDHISNQLVPQQILKRSHNLPHYTVKLLPKAHTKDHQSSMLLTDSSHKDHPSSLLLTDSSHGQKSGCVSCSTHSLTLSQCLGELDTDSSEDDDHLDNTTCTTPFYQQISENNSNNVTKDINYCDTSNDLHFAHNSCESNDDCSPPPSERDIEEVNKNNVKSMYDIPDIPMNVFVRKPSEFFVKIYNKIN